MKAKEIKELQQIISQVHTEILEWEDAEYARLKNELSLVLQTLTRDGAEKVFFQFFRKHICLYPVGKNMDRLKPRKIGPISILTEMFAKEMLSVHFKDVEHLSQLKYSRAIKELTNGDSR